MHDFSLMNTDFNGQIIRFMPGDDVKRLFPLIYNMEFGDNRDYIEENKNLDGLLDQMQKKLIDKQFSEWQKQYPVEIKKQE